MTRFPEFLQFRAKAGTSEAIASIAEADGKRVGDVVREAVEHRIGTAKPAPQRVELDKAA